MVERQQQQRKQHRKQRYQKLIGTQQRERFKITNFLGKNVKKSLLMPFSTLKF